MFEQLLLFSIIIMLIKMSYIDYSEYLVSDLDILITAVLVVAYKFILNDSLNSLYGFAINTFFYLLVFWFSKWYYKGEEYYGQGDVLVNMLLGYLIGVPGVFELLICVSILMLCYCLPLLLIKKKKALEKATPLIPFYSIASLIVLFY